MTLALSALSSGNQEYSNLQSLELLEPLDPGVSWNSCILRRRELYTLERSIYRGTALRCFEKSIQNMSTGNVTGYIE